MYLLGSVETISLAQVKADCLNFKASMEVMAQEPLQF